MLSFKMVNHMQTLVLTAAPVRRAKSAHSLDAHQQVREAEGGVASSEHY